VLDGFGTRGGGKGRRNNERGAGDDHEGGHHAGYFNVEGEGVFVVAAEQQTGAEDLGEDLDMALKRERNFGQMSWEKKGLTSRTPDRMLPTMLDWTMLISSRLRAVTPT
jgi:hypothetical protein